MHWITDPHAWIALLTLTALEIVLGIDNIVFITILAGKLPPRDQNRARQLGLAAAMVTRILLLLSISWIMSLTQPLFTIFDNGLSGRDLILLVGGMFLIWKSTTEIHEKVEGEEDHEARPAKVSFAGVIVQIMLLDIVFSLDSVITAVGMADDIGVMISAVVVSVGIMMFAAKSVGDFVQRHPTVKMLALAFLILIGVNLMAEGWHFHIPKGYVYFAMAFSVFVEMLNLRVSKKRKR
ncbi:MAG: TerC family protein [Bryobacteraceae bacterium]|nr:TerC family protein [Bryobacteraceae bacterium]